MNIRSIWFIGLLAVPMPPAGWAPAAIVPPAIDDRSYDDLVTETASRIPAHTPEWTNFNDSDPGFRLLDIFVLMGPATLEEELLHYHMKPFWMTLPYEDDEFRSQFAYTYLDAALTLAETPGAQRPPDWLAQNGINSDWTFNELITAANIPEPGSGILLVLGVVIVVKLCPSRAR